MLDIAVAWEAVHAALDRLPGWEVTRPQWHPEERQWVASAFYAGHLHRFEHRPAVEARGASEAEALAPRWHSPCTDEAVLNARRSAMAPSRCYPSARRRSYQRTGRCIS